MSDTRKDKRAPVSLKVRFKSATVDEFIEQYARDISRGGLFIKSKQPMPIGTLLKFEFQLKDESKLIQGVGRVVWKREATDSDGDTKPAGMGIKFIKMEPDSKALVEQIVEGRGDGPGQYESGVPAGELEGEGDEAGAAPKRARPVRSQKATMQFFPSTTPASELPRPEDRTQVRHASEFLASALASGGVDDLASKEAETKAEEARRRTEEIEREREAQAKAAREEQERAARENAERERQQRERQEREEAEREAAEREKKAAKAKLEAAATVEAPEAKPSAAEPKAEPAKKTPSQRPPAKTPSVSPKKVAPPIEPAPAPAGGSNLVLPIAAVLLLGLGIGGYIYLNRGGAATTAGTPPEATTRTEPGGEEPGAEPGREGGTEIATGTEPGGEGSEPGGTEPGGTEPGGTEPGGTEPGGEAVEPTAPAPTFEVRIETTPPGATLTHAGAEIGTSPATVSLPEGTQTVTARLPGYAEGRAEIAVAEGVRPTRITLTALPYAVEVTTTPPGARVRIGTRTGTAPGRVEITRPTGPVRVTASLAGFNDATATIDPATFAETDGTMVASVALTLTARAARTGGTGGAGTRPPRDGTGGAAGGGGAGGGGSGGGETGGGETGGGGGGETGGGSGGSGGGTTAGGSDPVPENPF